MKTYTVQVIITISGWIPIEAESLDLAKAKANKLAEETNISVNDLEDAEFGYDVMTGEMEEDEDLA